MDDPFVDEAAPITKFEVSPFVRLNGDRITLSPVVINDIELYLNLREREQRVLKYAVKNLNIITGATELNIEKVAVLEYGTYNDANRKKIKRAINDLVDKNIIAHTLVKDQYWLNRNVIWR